MRLSVWLLVLGGMAMATPGCKDKFSEIDKDKFILLGDQSCSWRKLGEQGFSGHLDARGYIENLGSIKKSKTYWILSHRNFENYEDGRVVIVSGSCGYVGSYKTGSPSFSVGEEQGEIIFDVPPELGDVIAFTDRGPPEAVIVNGKSFKLVL